MAGPLVVGIGDEVIWYCGAVVAIIAGVLAISRFLPDWVTSFWDPPTDMNPITTGQLYNSDVCPICLEHQRLAVETNCGHNFCGQCISNYVNSRSPRLFSSVSCPMCRQDINLLLINFPRDTVAADPAEKREVELAVYEFNVRFGNGPRSWIAYIRDCPVLVRHVISDFFSIGGLVWMFRVRVISCFAVAVMYLLLPLDIIPESVFGFFGLLDDAIIIFLCAIYLTIIYRRLLVNRANVAEM